MPDKSSEMLFFYGKPELLDFFADVRRQWYIQWTGLWGRDNE
jgi:hypothetical protein